ncbi:MAG: aminodeoxychorismate/anthranilate synthase component II [bacterium]|nr:aminodeoxychorismate/anthranilate synthase component II [bacterium]
MIVLLDNRDSFTFNIAQVLMELEADVHVVRSDRVSSSDVAARAPRAIVLGPGPGVPADGGCTEEVVRELSRDVPMLGVCLGHQALATAFGGALVRSRELVHGMTRPVTHDRRGVFSGLPSPVAFARYNSLAVDEDTLPEGLEVSARGPDGEIMALRHRERPLEGVQFHPESILCVESGGRALLANFLAGVNLARSGRR